MAGRFRLGTGGVTSTDGGRIFTRTLVPGNIDPNYGILGLENAATSTWQQGSVSVASIRRKSLKRRLLRVQELSSTTVAAPNTSRGIAPVGQFTTSTTRSRQLKSIGWIPALTVAASAPVVPASAWFVQPMRKRPAQKRRIQKLPEAKWQSMWTILAGALQPPKAKVIRFDRKIRLASPQLLYPPTTGPPVVPYPSWIKPEVKKIQFNVRLQKTPQLNSYPFVATVSSGGAIIAPFVTNIGKSRRLQKQPQTLAVATATPGTSSAPVAAFGQTKTNRRKKHEYPLVITISSVERPPVTAAVYPSFVPQGFRKRRDTHRKIQKTPPILHVAAAAPSVSQAPIAAITPVKKHRRKARTGLFMVDGGMIGQTATVPATEPAFRAVKAKRSEFRVKLQKLVHNPVYPQAPVPAQPQPAWRLVSANRTTVRVMLQVLAFNARYPQAPVPPQPSEAFKAPIKFWTTQKRRLLLADVQLEFPPTPFVPSTSTVQTPAGRHKKRTRYLVRVDGQTFWVEDEKQAQTLLDRVTALAPEAADAAATKLGEKIKSAQRLRPVELRTPKIVVSPEISHLAERAERKIAEVYKAKSMELEIRLLLQRKMQQDDDDAAITLILLN